MGYRYIYDKYGNLKAVVDEDDYTATVIDVHKGVVGTVIKGKGGIRATAISNKKGIVGFADRDDDAIGLLLNDDDDD
jgi:transcription antitermination factor NusA-like protein